MHLTVEQHIVQFLLLKSGQPAIEIEFTQAGAKDLAEIDQAVMDSAVYLRAQGFEF